MRSLHSGDAPTSVSARVSVAPLFLESPAGSSDTAGPGNEPDESGSVAFGAGNALPAPAAEQRIRNGPMLKKMLPSIQPLERSSVPQTVGERLERWTPKRRPSTS